MATEAQKNLSHLGQDLELSATFKPWQGTYATVGSAGNTDYSIKIYGIYKLKNEDVIISTGPICKIFKFDKVKMFKSRNFRGVKHNTNFDMADATSIDVPGRIASINEIGDHIYICFEINDIYI